VDGVEWALTFVARQTAFQLVTRNLSAIQDGEARGLIVLNVH
jgi:hypothetical protein